MTTSTHERFLARVPGAPDYAPGLLRERSLLICGWRLDQPATLLLRRSKHLRVGQRHQEINLVHAPVELDPRTGVVPCRGGFQLGEGRRDALVKLRRISTETCAKVPTSGDGGRPKPQSIGVISGAKLNAHSVRSSVVERTEELAAPQRTEQVFELPPTSRDVGGLVGDFQEHHRDFWSFHQENWSVVRLAPNYHAATLSGGADGTLDSVAIQTTFHVRRQDGDLLPRIVLDWLRTFPAVSSCGQPDPR